MKRGGKENDSELCIIYLQHHAYKETKHKYFSRNIFIRTTTAINNTILHIIYNRGKLALCLVLEYI